MIKLKAGKEAKSRAWISDSENHRDCARDPRAPRLKKTATSYIKDKGKRIRDKPVVRTRDRAQWWPPAQTIIAPTIKFAPF